jgi:hypothetical protein
VSRPRTPVVVGLSPGIGTSTVRAALHAREGSLRDGAADILVCGTDGLAVAESLVTNPAHPRPVLLVAAPAWPPALQRRFGAVVPLPHVGRWAGLPPPLDEAAALLGQPFAHLPRPLQAYAASLRHVASVVVRSGLVAQPAPPVVVRPRSVELWRGLRPVERAERPAPIDRHDTACLDDEALEAAGRAG